MVCHNIKQTFSATPLGASQNAVGWIFVMSMHQIENLSGNAEQSLS